MYRFELEVGVELRSGIIHAQGWIDHYWRIKVDKKVGIHKLQLSHRGGEETKAMVYRLGQVDKGSECCLQAAEE